MVMMMTMCAGVSALVAFLWKMAQPQMAKMSMDEEHRLAGNGVGWRVKHRRTDAEGKLIKKQMPIGSLGVHQKQRGGFYPGGRRCRSLLIDVLGVGF